MQFWYRCISCLCSCSGSSTCASVVVVGLSSHYTSERVPVSAARRAWAQAQAAALLMSRSLPADARVASPSRDRKSVRLSVCPSVPPSVVALAQETVVESWSTPLHRGDALLPATSRGGIVVRQDVTQPLRAVCKQRVSTSTDARSTLLLLLLMMMMIVMITTN